MLLRIASFTNFWLSKVTIEGNKFHMHMHININRKMSCLHSISTSYTILSNVGYIPFSPGPFFPTSLRSHKRDPNATRALHTATHPVPLPLLLPLPLSVPLSVTVPVVSLRTVVVAMVSPPTAAMSVSVPVPRVGP